MLTLLAAVAAPAAAQDSAAPPHRVFAGVGFGGAAGTDDVGGAGGFGQLTWQRAPHHAALRGLGVSELFSSGDGVSEVGALYGRTVVFGGGHAAVAAGLSFVYVDRGGPTGDVETVGIPVTAEAALEYRVLGLGIQVFANLNPESTYAGLMFFLSVGWMPVR